MHDNRTYEPQCRAMIQMLIQQHGWRLWPEDQWVEDMLARLPATPVPPEQLRQLAINLYCSQALYPACAGKDGKVEERRGFEELTPYLHRVALKSWPAIAEDVAQETSAIIYEKIGDCRIPGAFLAFALQKLRDTAKKQLRRGAKEYSLDELLETEGTDERQFAIVTMQTTLETPEDLILKLLRQQVTARLKHLRNSSARAQRQLDAVWLRYVQLLTTEETAQQLGTTPANVSVLVNRGLEHLRQDAELYRLAQEIDNREPDV